MYFFTKCTFRSELLNRVGYKTLANMVRLSSCVKHPNFFETSLFPTKIYKSAPMVFIQLPRKFEVNPSKNLPSLLIFQSSNLTPVHRAVAARGWQCAFPSNLGSVSFCVVRSNFFCAWSCAIKMYTNVCLV